MPTITINRKEFEKLVGKKLPEDKLKDRISMLGTDLEEVTEEEITVEIFPDRPDMLSVPGFARAFSSFIGVKTGLRGYKVNKSKERIIVADSVKKVRPYTVCAIVKDLEFSDEKIKDIIQIQEKLHITFGRKRKKLAIGIYPFDKIKMPITYFAEDPTKVKFRPLEFPRELSAIQILSQHPAGKEYAHLLEGKKLFPFFKDANNNILSMPPIINSHETGRITSDTKDIFIECSGFDFNQLSYCLNIIVSALADLGGKIYSLELDYGTKKYTTPDLSIKEMPLNIDYTNKILGLNLKSNEIKPLLEKMGYGYKNNNVLIPAYRVDILHEIDLVEDIAIAYGFENFKEEIPNVATIGEESPLESFKDKIANILVGLNVLEVSSYNMINKEDATTKMCSNIPCIELDNPVNIDYNILRPGIIPSLMKILSENKIYEYPQYIFELGIAFELNDKTETGTSESTKLAVALCNNDADFTRIKQILDALFNAIDLKYEIIPCDNPSFIPGRVGQIIINKKQIGFIGELHPQVISNFNIELPISVFEIDLNELFEVMKK